MPVMVEHRTLLAAVIAPWAAPLAYILYLVVMSGGWPFHYELPLVIAASVITGYAGLLVLGLPLVYILRQLGWLSLVPLALSGAVAGGSIFYAFVQVLGLALGSSAPFGVLELLWGAALGISVAVTFGVVAGVPLRSGGRQHAGPRVRA